MKVGGLREVMDGSEIIPPGAFSFELLTSAAHLRQAVTQELAATSGKHMVKNLRLYMKKIPNEERPDIPVQ